MIPSQQELLFPLLEVINAGGGEMSPREVYDELARRVGLSDEERAATVPNGAEGRHVNAWERRVRNTRQTAVARGYVEGEPGRRRFNLWAITEKTKRGLLNCKPGVCVIIYQSELGTSLWAECQSAVGLFEDESIDLIFTSPPYPLRRQKAYGNRDEEAHVEWLLACLSEWKPKLKETGSLVLNMADVWQPGSPTVSLYQERLMLRLCDEIGFNLNQKLFWQNPSKLPSPAEWVTVRRVRVTPSVEQCWWLGAGDGSRTKAKNANALRPYSESMARLLAAGGERSARVRPSGHAIKPGAFAGDNGGSIAQSLITAANTSSNDQYQRACRAFGLPVHPARFPQALPNFFIRLLTDPGDHVVDIFGGSATTGEEAERLGRRWTCVEKSLAYGLGGLFRFSADALRSVNRDLWGATALGLA